MGRRHRILGGLFVVTAVSLAGLAVAQATVGDHPVPTWQTNGRVNAIFVKGDTVYLGGRFTALRAPGTTGPGTVRNHAAAIDLDSGALLPWNPNANGNVLTLTGNKTTVYLGGGFTTVGGLPHKSIAAVDGSTGAVRPPFTASANGQVASITLHAGIVYAGGSFTSANGNGRSNLAAFDSKTGALESWSPTADDDVRAIVLTTDFSKLVIGGQFTHVNGSSQNNLAAVNLTTGATAQWHTHTAYPIIALAADAAGVYAAGGGNGGNFSGYDPSTGTMKWEGGTDGNLQAVGVVDGVVYYGGHYENYCGPQKGSHTCSAPVRRLKLLAVNEGSGGLQSWNPSANSVLGIFALLGDPATGDVFAGGDFSTIGGQHQQGIAEFRP